MKLVEIFIVALTLYREAGGESYRGKELVASTIVWDRNRKSAGTTWQQTCQNPARYSCWRNEDAWPEPEYNSQSWKDCMAIAFKVVSGAFAPANVSHYYNPAKASPSWGPQLQHVIVEGRHRFGLLSA